MKIVICGSIEFTNEIKKVADELIKQNHQVDIPLTAQKILNGELTLEQFKEEKQRNGDSAFRKMQDDVIKKYFDIINNSDAILILNIDKNNTKNYIGGNTFLEIGFAHVLNKKIYLYNEIPDMHYTDEIKAMQPIVLNGDLSKIRK